MSPPPAPSPSASADPVTQRQLWVSLAGEPGARAVITWPSTPGAPVVIELSGVWCTLTVLRVRDLLMNVSRQAEEAVELDLEDVTFIDGRGIRLIVDAHRELADNNHPCRITRASACVRRVFSLVDLDGLMDDGGTADLNDAD